MSQLITLMGKSVYSKRVMALLCGILFGIGLVISQMVNPNKVLNFLDITGNWDPSLIFVMIGALAVYGLGYWLIVDRRVSAIFGDKLPKRSQSDIDKPLLIGAVTFGIGWGMSGFCPGPAITNASSFDLKIIVFIVMMAVGMKVGDMIKAKLG